MDFQSKWTKNGVMTVILTILIKFVKNPPDFLKIHNFSKKTRKLLSRMPLKFSHFFVSQGVPREKLRNWHFWPFLTNFWSFLAHFELILLVLIKKPGSKPFEVIYDLITAITRSFFINFCSFLIEIWMDLTEKWSKLMIFEQKRSLFLIKYPRESLEFSCVLFFVQKKSGAISTLYIYI